MKNIRKITAVLLSVVMLLTALPLTTFAATSGDYSYVILADGTAEITDYTGAGGDVTIPDTIDGYTVTAIGGSAFSECDALTSIVIPDSVTTIGGYAFSGCDALTTVEIGDSVTTIGDAAFSFCDALTSIEIPDSVRSIGISAFSYTGYYNQKSNWENGVLYIGNHCIVADKYEIPNEYTIREGTITIADYAFSDCDALTSVEIPDGVTTIGDYAFYSCDALTTVEIGNSVTAIGDLAFSDCDALTTVVIPDSVTTISDSAFWSCDALTAITVAAENPNYSSDADGVLYNKDKTTLIQYPIGNSRTAYTIPDSVTTIGDSAFMYCEALTTVEMGDSVTTIGVWAFSGCDALTTIAIPDSVTTIGDSAFSGCDALTTAEIPDSVTTIGAGAFSGCSALTTVEIPDSVTTIGAGAFSECDALTSIVIPDSVTTIGDNAFTYSRALTKVEIPDSVTTIGYAAFGGCDALTAITVAAENPNYSSDADGVLYNKDKTTLIQYPIGNSRTAYTIPDSVTTIGDVAFYGCGSLTTVEIGNSVTTIGDAAFAYSRALTTVEIPDSVTTIGDEAFRGCDALTTVYYTGTQEQWNAITIGSNNDPLLNAELIFGEMPEDACAAGHTEEIIPGKAATCTEAGWSEGKMCSVCGESLQPQEEIPALGHKWQHMVIPSTCAAVGIRYQFCLHCGEMSEVTLLPSLAHTPGEWEVVREPSDTQTGWEEQHCTVCGALLHSRETEKLQESPAEENPLQEIFQKISDFFTRIISWFERLFRIA